MQIGEWLSTDLGQQIWENKYRNNGETLGEWFERVSGSDKEIVRLIKEKKFLFGGRTLSNRGLNNGSYSNCYSSGFVLDNLDDIMQINTNLALTYKAQGGQGVSLSKIRPKGALIGGRYTSDGIVPIMEMYNKTTESIMQGGSRKGALMISIDITHKEADTFITIKSDLDRINKANLSVEIDDAFMNIVKQSYESNKDLSLDILREYEGQTIAYTIIPIKLYKLLIQQAHLSAEPGVIFTERFRNYNLMEFVDSYKIETCNPCFTGDMNLLTESGYKPIGTLDGQEVQLINASGDKSLGKIWCSGEKPTIAIKFFNKYKSPITCTEDHRFMLTDGSECEAKDLKGKRIMPYLSPAVFENKTYIAYGFIQGDGNLNRLNSDRHKGLEINIGIKDGQEIADLFSLEYKEGKRHYYTDKYNDILTELEFSAKILPEREFPSTFDNWEKQNQIEFIRGCYSANGSIIKNQRISYKTSSENFATKLNEWLVENGYNSYITTNKPTETEWSNGIYTSKQSYDINIAQYPSMLKFYNTIGFVHQYKMDSLKSLLLNESPKVSSVKSTGKVEKVYDFNEPLTHWGIIEDVVAHNCGEQPLPKDGACNLGSINLSEYVKNPFTKDAEFDFHTFSGDVSICVRGLDAIIDENLDNHALQAQKEMSQNYRNIGLGIMGLADALIKLGLVYGDLSAVKLTRDIMMIMFISSTSTSVALAEEKGAFPKYTPEVFDASILKSIFAEEELERLKKVGIRNASLLSIAPTGSLGTMLNISTGIEPNFAISYKRKTESLHGEGDVYYDVYTGIAEEYMKQYEHLKLLVELPDYFVTSHNIDWKDRINMQAAAQDYVDTAISATINLPNTITVEEVEELYLYAWEKGLKGVTIFRDGSRVGVLNLEGPKEEEEFFTRPESLDTKVVHFINEGTPWVAFIGTREGKPFEVFSGPADMESFPIPKAVKEGQIIKVKSEEITRYDFRYTDTYGYQNTLGGLSRIFNKEYWNYARLVSGMLRSQIDLVSIVEIVDSMHTDSESLHNWKNGVIRALKTFIGDGTTASEKCPDCGEDMIYVGGCKQCSACGWSKCS